VITKREILISFRVFGPSFGLLPIRLAAMADYWISRDKYFCKYCNIYIADDKPVRSFPRSLARRPPLDD
jgi:hypothetical protein